MVTLNKVVNSECDTVLIKCCLGRKCLHIFLGWEIWSQRTPRRNPSDKNEILIMNTRASTIQRSDNTPMLKTQIRETTTADFGALISLTHRQCSEPTGNTGLQCGRAQPRTRNIYMDYQTSKSFCG